MRRLLGSARRGLVLGLVCALTLTATTTLAAVFRAGSGAKISARLTQSTFARPSAPSVRLIYTFSKPCSNFSYALSYKPGHQNASWRPVKSVSRKGRFGGTKSMTIRQLFGRQVILVGSYRLQLSCGSSTKVLKFRVAYFWAQLTKRRFPASEARSVKLIYEFSKPSRFFSYRLSHRVGSGWRPVKALATKKTKWRYYFRGRKKTTVLKLFAGKPILTGAYRLKLASDRGGRLISFTVTSAGPGGGGSGSGSGSGSGNAGIGNPAFTITGGVSGLQLGQARPIELTLTNPNGVPLYVTSLTVTVSADSTPPGCPSASNLQITQSNASSSNPITIPANGSVTLTSAPRAPQIVLLDLPVNQDVCKSKSFALTYGGSAHS